MPGRLELSSLSTEWGSPRTVPSSKYICWGYGFWVISAPAPKNSCSELKALREALKKVAAESLRSTGEYITYSRILYVSCYGGYPIYVEAEGERSALELMGVGAVPTLSGVLDRVMIHEAVELIRELPGCFVQHKNLDNKYPLESGRPASEWHRSQKSGWRLHRPDSPPPHPQLIPHLRSPLQGENIISWPWWLGPKVIFATPVPPFHGWTDRVRDVGFSSPLRNPRLSESWVRNSLTADESRQPFKWYHIPWSRAEF